MSDTAPSAVADHLVSEALDELGQTYGEQVFYVERDIVWTVQRRLTASISVSGLPWRVYNDYPMIPGTRRALSADLAISDSSGHVLAAIEFKYEPCHRRIDVLKSKLPVTAWSEIVKDTDRVRDFVGRGITPVAYATVIDEGGYLARRDLSVYAQRQTWSGAPHHDHPVEALIFRFGSSAGVSHS